MQHLKRAHTLERIECVRCGKNTYSFGNKLCTNCYGFYKELYKRLKSNGEYQFIKDLLAQTDEDTPKLLKDLKCLISK